MRGWRIRIANPFTEKDSLTKITLRDIALASSGRRYQQKHLRDRHRNQTAESDFYSTRYGEKLPASRNRRDGCMSSTSCGADPRPMGPNKKSGLLVLSSGVFISSDAWARNLEPSATRN